VDTGIQDSAEEALAWGEEQGLESGADTFRAIAAWEEALYGKDIVEMD
jgi:hypothetical protein